MKIFVTGASGYIGHTVARAVRAKGHRVYGLVRRQEDADLLSLDEITPLLGDLEYPESYQRILDEVEVAVHCAFDSSGQGIEQDAQTIDTIINVFSKSSLPKIFVYTSGVWVYGSKGSEIVDETSPLDPLDIVKWRPTHEEKVLKANSAQLKTVVLRPGNVFGNVGGFTNFFFTSIENGTVSIVGEGNNRWPMVHVQDLAHAYVSVVEKELSHVILNVTDDSSATVREMAEAVAKAAEMSGRVKEMSTEEAEQHFGPLVPALKFDLKVDNSRIKRLIGWHIHHAPFINEVEIYYQAWKTTQQEQGAF